MIWILVPIYVNLVAAEYFKEKKGTGLGNAATNGAITLWIGIDWVRIIVNSYKGFTFLFVVKIFLCLLTILFAAIILYEGLKGKPIVRYIGRVREVSYVLLVFTPVIYEVMKPDWKYAIAIVVFFPLYYYLIELLDRILPDPKVYEEKKKPPESYTPPASPSKTSEAKSSSDSELDLGI